MKWFIGVVLFLALALVLQSGLLAYAMYVLLGLLLIGRFLARNWIAGLAVSRACNRYTAEVDDTVAVNLTVRNESGLPVPWVIAEDLLPKHALGQKPPRLKVKGKRIAIQLIRARGEKTLRYQVQFKMRGCYQLGPAVLESGDLFGLHRRYRVGAEPHYVLVYPKVVPLEGYDIASRRPIGEVRLTHRLYEDPTRISGVREYQSGDPLNRVHWKATARTGRLHSKVYEPSTLAGTTMVLDFHQAGYPARGEPYRSELAVTAAVSLANAVCLLGQQVGLVTNGRDATERIRLEGWLRDESDFRTRDAARQKASAEEVQQQRMQPFLVETRRGVEQFQRIREALARVELNEGLTFAQLLIESQSRLPRDATVLALLGDVPPETAVALGSLRRQGYAVTAVLVMFQESQLERAFGHLRAEGINDIRFLNEEKALSGLCQRQALFSGPYGFADS